MERAAGQETVTRELRAGPRTAWDAAVGIWMLTVVSWPFAVVLAAPVLVSASGIISTPWPVMLAFGPLFLGLLFVSMVRTNRKALREGTVLTSTSGPASITVTGPHGTSDVPYDAVTNVTANSRVVRLRLEGGAAVVLPRALVPEDALEEMRRRSAASDTSRSS